MWNGNIAKGNCDLCPELLDDALEPETKDDHNVHQDKHRSLEVVRLPLGVQICEHEHTGHGSDEIPSWEHKWEHLLADVDGRLVHVPCVHD